MELDKWEHFDNGDSIIVVNTRIEIAAPQINVFVANKKDITKNKSIYDVMVELQKDK
mgnify:FL=1